MYFEVNNTKADRLRIFSDKVGQSIESYIAMPGWRCDFINRISLTGHSKARLELATPSSVYDFTK